MKTDNNTENAAIEYLRTYNKWRMPDDDRTMDEAGITPAGVTAAIDGAIDYMDKLERELAAVIAERDGLLTLKFQLGSLKHSYASLEAVLMDERSLREVRERALEATSAELAAEKQARETAERGMKEQCDTCEIKCVFDANDRYAKEQKQRAEKAEAMLAARKGGAE